MTFDNTINTLICRCYV